VSTCRARIARLACASRLPPPGPQPLSSASSPTQDPGDPPHRRGTRRAGATKPDHAAPPGHAAARCLQAPPRQRSKLALSQCQAKPPLNPMIPPQLHDFFSHAHADPNRWPEEARLLVAAYNGDVRRLQGNPSYPSCTHPRSLSPPFCTVCLPFLHHGTSTSSPFSPFLLSGIGELGWISCASNVRLCYTAMMNHIHVVLRLICCCWLRILSGFVSHTWMMKMKHGSWD
jgi:hypothetical protein